jgi:hypothetical protein
MQIRIIPASLLLAFAAMPLTASAADNADLAKIQSEIAALRANYDARIADLEHRLQDAEAKAGKAEASAAQAQDTAVQASQAAQAAPTGAPAAANAFNPAVSLILSGTYGSFQRDPGSYHISGFQSGGEIGPGDRGFSLAESELGIAANIDPWFYGAMNFSIHSDDTVSTEEAYVQTTALPHGLTVKAGRFFSGVGYLNAQHAHTWDFVDAPLAYQAFLGGQYGDDGIQLKWLAPTDTFLEFGAELGRGRNFPGSDTSRNGAGSQSLFAHVGGDVGVSNNWRAGLSLLRTTPQDRQYDDADNGDVTNAFTGTSRLLIADFVWKWAPNGDATHTNLKLQGEYFRRRESGDLYYDVNTVDSLGDYRSTQSGWYVQSVYQFMPAWRVGLRYDRLDSGSVDYGANSSVLATSDYAPTRYSLMFDWSGSEFSRWRIQFSRDKARADEADNQVMVQYQMSLGAHGAHSY